MVLEGEFKFLKLEQKERKESEKLSAENKHYYILNLLDEDNTPVKFYSFNYEVSSKLIDLSKRISSLQDLLVKFSLEFSNNNWNVRLIDVVDNY